MLGIVEKTRLRRRPGGVADREEPGAAARLGLVGVDREGVKATPTGMGHMVGAAAQRAAGPGVEPAGAKMGTICSPITAADPYTYS